MGQPKKQGRVTFPSRICSSDCSVQQESIQCDGCQTASVGYIVTALMSTTVYVNFSHFHLQFFADSV